MVYYCLGRSWEWEVSTLYRGQVLFQRLISYADFSKHGGAAVYVSRNLYWRIPANSNVQCILETPAVSGRLQEGALYSMKHPLVLAKHHLRVWNADANHRTAEVVSEIQTCSESFTTQPAGPAHKLTTQKIFFKKQRLLEEVKLHMDYSFSDCMGVWR